MQQVGIKKVPKAVATAKTNPDALGASAELVQSTAEAQGASRDTYQEKYSKWMEASLKGLTSSFWWAMASVSHRLSAPWSALKDHLHKHHFLLATTSAGSLARLVFNPEARYVDFLMAILEDLPLALASSLRPCHLDLVLSEWSKLRHKDSTQSQ